MRQNHVEYSEFVGRAVDIIDWGRQIWKDVNRIDRGTIFDSTFLRGVLSLELDALTKVSMKCNTCRVRLNWSTEIQPVIDISCRRSREDQDQSRSSHPTGRRGSCSCIRDSRASRLCAGILELSKVAGISVSDDLFIHSNTEFFRRMLGFYHKMKGNVSSENAVKEGFFQRAALHYIAAASCLPEDDENHCCMAS